jgi:hypothetical protein
MQVPFSGPSTYDIVARRFSSYPNPTDFFVRKNLEEARDRGEFIDIHDVSGVDPKDYDVLITDMDYEKLRSKIAEVVGIQYLVKATEADADNVVQIGMVMYTAGSSARYFHVLLVMPVKLIGFFSSWTVVSR